MIGGERPILISMDGQQLRFPTEVAACAYVSKLGTQVRESTRANIEAKCMLGWALRQLHEAMPGTSLSSVCRRCGIHQRMGDYAVKFAGLAADPETGRLDLAKWDKLQREAKAWWENRGKKPPRNPDTNECSINAVMIANGLRTPPRSIIGAAPTLPRGGRIGAHEEPRTGEVRSGVLRVGDWSGESREKFRTHDLSFGNGSGDGGVVVGAEVDPVEAALGLAAARPRAVAPKPAGCVGATQPELPFRLAESARSLAERAEAVERALAMGQVDRAVGQDLQTRLDALLREMEALA